MTTKEEEIGDGDLSLVFSSFVVALSHFFKLTVSIHSKFKFLFKETVFHGNIFQRMKLNNDIVLQNRIVLILNIIYRIVLTKMLKILIN